MVELGAATECTVQRPCAPSCRAHAADLFVGRALRPGRVDCAARVRAGCAQAAFLLHAAVRFCVPRLAEHSGGHCALVYARSQRSVERPELALRVDEHVPPDLRIVIGARRADEVLNGVAARVMD